MIWAMGYALVTISCFALLWIAISWMQQQPSTAGALAALMDAVGPWLPWLVLMASALVAMLLVSLIFGLPSPA